MSLYLKYRPFDFNTVVNQSHIIDIIRYQVSSWKTTNNYLFFWSRWTWKTTLARILARAVNCQNLSDWNPCNKCESCLGIIDNKNIDFVEIDAASHTQVDNIREEILEKAIYPPSNLSKKVYIIDEVHMLSKSAFNALLKIMEEPPSYVFFILATTEINKVPDTIVSRSQVFNFKKLSLSDIWSRLEYISDNEWFSYNKEWLDLIAYYSDWALRDAIKYLEQVSSFGDITEENVSNFLWIVSSSKIEEFLWLIISADLNSLDSFISSLSKSWYDLIDFLKQVLLRIDNKFLDNPKLYSELSWILISILKDSKSFPNLNLLIKSYLFNYIKKST